MNTLIPFEYKNHKLQVINFDGDPWFVAKDACEILEHSDSAKAVSRLESDEKLLRTIFVSGQNRETWLVNESGLYALVFLPEKRSESLPQMGDF